MRSFQGINLITLSRKLLLFVLMSATITISHFALTTNSAALEAIFTVNQVFEVTSAADSGPGTLRQAMLDMAAGDTITFDTAVFSPTSPVTITLQSELPTIALNDVMIDASDAGVILDGSQIALANSIGLNITGSDGVTVRGLQIVNFTFSGIRLAQGATNTVVGGDRLIGNGPLGQGNLISQNLYGVFLENFITHDNLLVGNLLGTDITGTFSRGNEMAGVVVSSGASQNRIQDNVISGNDLTGVMIRDAQTSNNEVVGNLIGTDITGSVALPNGQNGIHILSAVDNVIGGVTADLQNIISGNTVYGIQIDGNGATGNQALGNLIGLDSAGATAVANDLSGIYIGIGASGNIIGGSSTGKANVLSGNGRAGVEVAIADNNEIRGNIIGLDATGSAPIGNSEFGVILTANASNNRLQANVISGNNGHGLFIGGSGTDNNVVLGNIIGLNPAQTDAIGNKGTGILINLQAANNRIGGYDQAAQNIISGNKDQGVWLASSGTTGQEIIGNKIGVDGVGDGVFPNGVGIVIDARASHNTAVNNEIAHNYNGGIIIGDNATLNQTTGNLFQDNYIHHNGGTAVKTVLGNELLTNNIANNRYNAVQVIGGELIQDEIWTTQGDLTTYVVTRDISDAFDYNLGVPALRQLTIEAGVTVQFDLNLGANISGTLNVNGSKNAPVHFASSQRFTNPQPGNWNGLNFAPGSQGIIDHASIEFAQNGIQQTGGAITLTNSTVAASGKQWYFATRWQPQANQQ